MNAITRIGCVDFHPAANPPLMCQFQAWKSIRKFDAGSAPANRCITFNGDLIRDMRPDLLITQGIVKFAPSLPATWSEAADAHVAANSLVRFIFGRNL